MTRDEVDVLVIGAGLSGIGAGYHLQTKCPRLSYTILESRDAIGGTWDLFRYPGIRSDSDMYTLGYPFRPWRSGKSIADGPSILAYIRQTARDFGIDRKVRFGHRAVHARWSSATRRWTVEATHSGAVVRITCRFLFMCSGYYDYAEGYTPEFPGRELFRGSVVHPQRWPEDLAYEGKRVVVIGSGATAVTLVPELAKKAAHVTMLQRSPSYVLSLPAVDPISAWLRSTLPADTAYDVTRLKNVSLAIAMYTFCRAYPKQAKKMLVSGVKKQLGTDFDVATHFTPRYAPWDQRLCFVPDGDLFEAIARGRADVVTDAIEGFTEAGLRLRSKGELPADIVVTATGLKLLLAGGIALEVDGAPVRFGATKSYKGTMLSGVPNFALALGYTNASWTLKSDLVCRFVCRVLQEMGKHGYTTCVPEADEADDSAEPIIDFSSSYVRRSVSDLPKQGKSPPWKLHQNYFLDVLALGRGPVADGVLQFR